MRVTETRSADGDWVQLADCVPNPGQEDSDCWIRFKKPDLNFMTPIADPEVERQRMSEDPSSSWLSASLNILWYNIGRQTLSKHPHETSSDEPEPAQEERDSSQKWLESALMIGGPTATPSAQFAALSALGEETNPEVQATKMLAMVQAFEPADSEVQSRGWWNACLSSDIHLQASIKEMAAGALEEKTAKSVFSVMLRHAGRLTALDSVDYLLLILRYYPRLGHC